MSERIDIFGVEPVVLTDAQKREGLIIKGVRVECESCKHRATPRGELPCDDCYNHLKWEPKAKADAVNHPEHYTKGKIEVIEILESIVSSMDLTPTEAGLTWSVVKYMARWKNKGGAEDIKKAEWYLKRLIGEVGE